MHTYTQDALLLFLSPSLTYTHMRMRIHSLAHSNNPRRIYIRIHRVGCCYSFSTHLHTRTCAHVYTLLTHKYTQMCIYTRIHRASCCDYFLSHKLTCAYVYTGEPLICCAVLTHTLTCAYVYTGRATAISRSASHMQVFCRGSTGAAARSVCAHFQSSWRKVHREVLL